jgi:hypothetical protein
MVLVLNLRPVRDGETDLAEGAHDVLGDLRERMELAERAAAAGQSEIGRLFGQRGGSSSSPRRSASVASSSVLAALMALPAAGFSSFGSVPSCFISAVN